MVDEEVKMKMISRVPMGHMAEPEDVASLVAFLCNDGCFLCYRAGHLRQWGVDCEGLTNSKKPH